MTQNNSKAKPEPGLAAAISALINGWLDPKRAKRNLSQLSTKTGIGSRRLKSLSDGDSDPTISETMAILNTIHPNDPSEHRRFLLTNCPELPWENDQESEEARRVKFESMDFEARLGLQREKLSGILDSLQALLDDHRDHLGYLVEDTVKRIVAIEALDDQILAQYFDLPKRKPSKSTGQRRALAAYRTERRRRWTLEKEIVYLKSIIQASR